MSAEHAERQRDEVLAELADRIVHVARKLTAHPLRNPEIVPLSPLEAMVLRQVDRHPETSSTQLAADLGLRTSNASTVLRSLIEKGLLTRHSDPADRRAARFSLTAAASVSIVRLRAEWSRSLAQALPKDATPDAALAFLEQLDESLS